LRIGGMVNPLTRRNNGKLFYLVIYICLESNCCI
jgi:hypothetical protein